MALEKINHNDSLREGTDKLNKAIEVTQAIINENFQNAVLETEIAEKLIELETEYAPQLNQVKTQLDTVKSEANTAKMKSTTALEKANNPYATMVSNGSKIEPNDLSAQTLSLIQGGTVILAAGALEQNRGVAYPLKYVPIAGVTNTSIDETAKNAILDVKLFGAKIGHYYKLTMIANGNSSNGKTRYGVTLEEHKRDLIAVGNSRTRFIFIYNDDALAGNEQNANVQPSTEIIDTITVTNGEITLVVTFDRSVIAASNTSAFLNTGSTRAPSYIIDPSCCFFNLKTTSGGGGIDKVNVIRTSEQDFTIGLGDIALKFGKLGINSITHIVSYTHSSTNAITSDLISPYNAGTVTNGTIDNNHAAVSGNHGTDGSGGFATANNIKTSVLINEVEVAQDSSFVEAARIKVIVKNYVTNKANIDLTTGQRLTNDFIETVTYSFEKNHMQVDVELEAINDFYINWYLGLQLIRNGWNKDVYFNGDLTKTALYTQTASTLNSGTKSESPDMQRVTLRNDTGDVCHVYTNKDYGVGYDHIRNTDPILYLRDNYQKMYFHLIKNDNPLILLRGQKVKYHGGYIFSKNKAVNATNVSYFVENGALKAYVDFKKLATENINYSSVEESFNCTFGSNKITSTVANAYAKVII